MNPKYSFCCAVYNCDKYLDKCIKSVLNQTYDDFELILIDDFSSDKSGIICDEYALKDSRVRVIHNDKAMGSLYSRDLAMRESVGKYLLFPDSDDFFEENTLKLVDKVFDEYDCDLVEFGFRRFNKKEIEYETEKKELKIYEEKDRRDFLMKVLLDPLHNTLWRKAVKGDLLRNNVVVKEDEYTIARGTDQFLTLDIYKLVRKVVMISDVLYNYRVNENGITVRQEKNYSLDFRNRQKLKNLIYNEKCLTKDDLLTYDEYSYKKFKSQLDRISILKTNTKEKISIYKRIKEMDFYNEYISKLLENKNNYEINLFVNNNYRLLIYILMFKHRILKLIK